jgi:class 3 adenylate cyclase
VSSRQSRKSPGRSSKQGKESAGGTGYNTSAVVASHHHAIAGLSQRAVSVVAGNLVGLHLASSRASAAGAADTVARHIERATTYFEEEVNANLGVMTFHGDRFLATFNAARPCASHASKALSTALALTVYRPDSDACRVACGVDTGRCVVGSMGSASMKALSTVGPVVTNAAVLEGLSRRRCAEACREGVCSRFLLATARTINDAAVAAALAVHCDIVALHTWTTTRDTVVSWFVSKDEAAAVTPTALATSLGAVDQQGQEWLYDHDQEARHPIAALNVPFESLAAGAAAAMPAPFSDDGSPPPCASAPACVRERYATLRACAAGAQEKRSTTPT